MYDSNMRTIREVRDEDLMKITWEIQGDIVGDSYGDGWTRYPIEEYLLWPPLLI